MTAAGVLCFLIAPCRAETGHGPKNATVLIIRHAEKPASGENLTPAGEARAQTYATYFKNFNFHGAVVKLDAIFAAADSKNSHRPRLTVAPLAQALGLTVNTSYPDKEPRLLADELSAHHAGGNILVCWHRGQMPELLQALGADPATLLPGGLWPEDAYAWVIALRYDSEGRLQEARRIDEGF